MDYFGVLKKAWNITWRYKALWILGLFAGAGSGGSSGGGGGGNTTYRGDSGSGSFDHSIAQLEQWIESNIVLIAVIAGVLAVIGVAFFILSIAAQGGLVWGTNEGAEDRKPSLRKAWSVGFSKWGRVFMVGFMLVLPVLVVLLVMLMLLVLGIGGAASLGDMAASGGALAGGMCCFLPLFMLVLIVLSVVIGIIYPLAVRYAVLKDVTFGQAIVRGWEDLRGKRGAVVFWLLMLLPAFAFGIVATVFVLPFIVISVPFFMAENFVGGFLVIVLGVLVLMLPSAVYSTFVSASWTVFFRRMTGMEPGGLVASGGPSVVEPPMAPAYVPPAPPAYAPPAAPVSDAPPPVPPAPPADE